MIYVLFLSLLSILIFDLIIRRFDVLRPTLWVIIGFMLSSVIGILNMSTWGDISIKTVIIILISVITFVFGSYIGEVLRIPYISKLPNIRSHFPVVFVLIMNIIMVITGIMYLKFMYNNALLAGSSGEWSNLFSYARRAEQMGVASNPSFILSILVMISYSFGFLQTFILLKDFVYHKIKGIRINDLVSSLLYFSHTILSGGRTKMMYFILFIIVVGLILYRNKNYWSKKSVNMGIKYIVYGFIIVILSFWIIEQTVRGSIYGSSYSLWYQMSKYIGSPIYALDIYLNNPTFMANFAETETLYSIISILNKFGMSIPFNNNALDFVSYSTGPNQVITNIYTGIRRYIHDYNYYGLIALLSFQSIFYSSYYSSIKRHRSENLSLLFYGIIVYPVAFYFIEERFLNDLFTLTMIIQYLMIYIFVYILKIFGTSSQKNKYFLKGDLK